MQKLFIIVLGISSSLVLCAQQKYQLDSMTNIWSHHATYTTTEHQRYDSSERILVWQSEVKDDSRKQHEGDRKILQYDQHGNEIMCIQSIWHGRDQFWQERDKNVKIYDEKGRAVSEIMYEMQNGTWTGTVKKTYEYEPKSCTNIRYRWDGETWIPIHKRVKFYNVAGREILIFGYQWDDIVEKWLYWTQEENIFVQDTILQTSATYLWEKNQWVNKEKMVYKFHPESGRISDQVHYMGKHDGWQYRRLKQIKHYPSVRREEIFNWNKRDSSWMAESFQEIYSNQAGRDTDFVLFTWNIDSSEYRRHKQGMTVYDQKNRVIQIQEVMYSDGEIESGTEILLDYDEDDNLFCETHRSLIGTDWSVQTKTEFSFDRNILLRNAAGEILIADRQQISHPYSTRSQHAINGIRSYRYLDEKPVLQEEWRYYYTKID